MPELPEVETVRAGLARHLLGRTVTAVELRRNDLRWPIPKERVRELTGLRCESVQRRSKYLQIAFAGARQRVALIHLGMTGRLWVDVLPRASSPGPDWLKHEHWRFAFGNRLLRFSDARRFGMLDVVAPESLAKHQLVTSLGPEPLSPEFDGEAVYARTRKRRASLKSYLMDSRNVVGVGNIYASESCFRAGLRPGKAAGRLTRAQCFALVAAVRAVLEEAIAQGGTTLRDFVSAEQESGYFQRSLAVYGREGEPCRRCGTPIRRVVDGARSTYYCAQCQR